MKLTTCTICQAASRDMTLKHAHCRPCHRKHQREKFRRQRGTPEWRFRGARLNQDSRPHPLGTCFDCGGVVAKNGRCREHYLEYDRRLAAAKRGRFRVVRG